LQGVIIKKVKMALNQKLDGDKTKDTDPRYKEYKEKLNLLNQGLGEETSDYNLKGAYDAGLVPFVAPDGQFHLGSRNPRTGEILKTSEHKSWDKMVEEEDRVGYELYQKDGKWFSRKKKEEDNVWKNKEFITDLKRNVHARSTTYVDTPEIENYPYTETDSAKNMRLKIQKYEGRVEVEVSKRLEEIPSVKEGDRHKYDKRVLPVKDVLNVSERTPLSDKEKERMYKDDIYKSKLIEDFLVPTAAGYTDDDKVFADEVFRDKYGQSIHSFLYDNVEEYRQGFKEVKGSIVPKTR